MQEIHGAEGLVYAHEGFGVGLGAAFHQGEVGFAGEFVYIDVLAEIAPRGTDGAAAHFFEQGFGAAAVFDEVGDGADFKAVLLGEFGELGHACHGAVVVDDFADNGGGDEAAHLG